MIQLSSLILINLIVECGSNEINKLRNISFNFFKLFNFFLFPSFFFSKIIQKFSKVIMHKSLIKIVKSG